MMSPCCGLGESLPGVCTPGKKDRYPCGGILWSPDIFFMQSAGLTFIMSQSQCAICPGLSLTQTRTREVVLDLFGPGTWRVCHS